jgi:hypothetical protein
MELDPGQDLTPEQMRLGEELAHVVEGPSTEARARIMAAVRAAPGPVARSRRWRWRRRALAAAGGLALVAGTGVTALAASAHAVPGSPAYTLRNIGERLRLSIAGTASREELRISFARDRLQQAAAAGSHGDKRVAAELLDDSRSYLQSAKSDLSALPAQERGKVEEELDEAGRQEQTTEDEVQQQGSTQPAPPAAPSQGSGPQRQQPQQQPPPQRQQPPPQTQPADNGSGDTPQTQAPTPSDGGGSGDVPQASPPPVGNAVQSDADNAP